MSNKFATALKPGRTASESSPTRHTKHPAPTQPQQAARARGKHVGAYFDPTVSKQLRQIALEEDSTVQLLLGEAIDMLFQARRKPTIAQRTAQS